MPPKASALSRDQAAEAGHERKFTGSLFRLHEARLPKRVKRRIWAARFLFDQQQPALLVAVGGIYGGEQAPTLDQPWPVVRIDVKDEH
jgi:hypothetical protein